MLYDTVSSFPKIEYIHTLTPIQQSMLFSYVSKGEHSYIEQLSWNLMGKFSPNHFRKAGGTAVVRHGAMRSVVRWENMTQPYQIVYDNIDSVVEEYNGFPESWLELEERERNLVANISHTPPSRVLLVKINDNQWRIIWTLHHIILDGWSGGLFLQDVNKYYIDPALELVPAPQFSHFVEWSTIQARDGNKREYLYWKMRFEKLETPTYLIIHDPLTENISEKNLSHSTYKELIFSVKKSAALANAALSFGVTLAVILQAATAFLLSRYTSQKEVCFGSVVSLRPPEITGITEMVGMFVSTLPIIAGVYPEQMVKEWIKAIAQNDVEGREYGLIPLADLARIAGIDNPQALVDVLFVVENMPRRSNDGDKAKFCACDVSDEKIAQNVAQPLSIVVYPGKELTIRFSYDCSRFTARSIESLMRHYQNILNSLVKASLNPKEKVGNISMFSEAEKALLIPTKFPDKHEGWIECTSMLEAFDRMVCARPDAIAVIDDYGSWTYADLNEESTRYQQGFAAHGVRKGATVALFLEKRRPFLAAILGAFKAGASYCPLDITYPPVRVSRMIQIADSSLVLTDKREMTSTLKLGVIPIITCEELLANESIELTAFPDGNAIALKIFTSGSTGEPKGMSLSHNGLFEAVQACSMDGCITSEDRVLALASPCFDVAAIELFMSLLCGSTIVLLPKNHTLPGEILEKTINAYQITASLFVPSIAKTLDIERMPSLRTVIMGGEKMPEDLAKEWAKKIRLVNSYGPAEISLYATSQVCNNDVYSIGRARYGCAIYVLDRDLNVVPPGVSGEICIASTGITNGYTRLPAHLQTAFIDNPFWQENTPFSWRRIYKSGDIGWLDEEGKLYYLGRRDTQVKINGVRFETSEIETLLRGYKGIHDAAVISATVVPSTGVNAITVLGAFLITDISISEELLRTYLLGNIPAAAIPSVFIAIDAFPLAGTGKLDSRKLSEKLSQVFVKNQTTNQDIPISSAEKVMAKLWGKILKVNSISRHDHFFKLGGDSIKVLQLVALAKRQGLIIQLEQLFITPEFAAFTNIVNDKKYETKLLTSSLCFKQIGATLSQSQQRLVNLVFQYGDGPIWHTAVGLIIHNKIDPELLSKAVLLVVKRHSGFRTGVTKTDTGYNAMYGEENVEIRIADLRQSGGIKTADCLAAAAFAEPLPLGRPPLLRCLIFHTAENEWAWCIIFHYLIVDPEARSLVFKEALAIYALLAAEQEVLLPPITEFAGIAYNELSALAPEAEKKWRDSFILPRKKLPPWNPDSTAQRNLTELPQEVSVLLATVVKHIGETPYIILATSMLIHLFKYTDEEIITFSSPLNKRNEKNKNVGVPISDEIHITMQAENMKDPVAGMRKCIELRNLAIKLSDVSMARRLKLYCPHDYSRPDGGAAVSISYLSSQSNSSDGGSLDMQQWNFPRYTSAHNIMAVFWQHDATLSLLLEHRISFLPEAQVKVFTADFIHTLTKLCSLLLSEKY